MVLLEEAVRRDRDVNPLRPTMKYRSHYGLCLALLTDRQAEAFQLCRQATETEFYNPDVFWNLGRVALMRGDRRSAFRAFRRGLQVDSGHPGLRFDMKQMGRRRKPTFPFLDREHALNRVAGMLWAQVAGAAPA
jgi:Tfp pilus assembly protein PilF